MGRLLVKQFSPKDLQGLALWLKADAGVTLSGSDVTAWADQSENGFSANGNVTDGINPTFVSNVKNGKPILRFGNSNNPTILRTAPTTFGNNGEFTIFTVHKYDNTNNTWAELISKGDLATEAGSQFAISPRFISSDPTTSAFGVMGYADDTYSWSFLYQEPASTSWSIVCGIQSITNNSQKYFVNGSLISESASVSAINQLNIAIGIGNGGSDSTPWSAEYGGFKGDLAEVIFYNRALTISERQKVEAYLNTKYAIYNPIPNNKISIKKQNTGAGKIKTYSNLLSNSRFDKNNDYPFNGFDANYFIGGHLTGGSKILGDYYHNSPLFYDSTYSTIANKTFHEINSPYTTLLYNHALQPRLLKMFGAGSKFSGTPNNTNYLKTITSTTSLTPTDNESWTKYGVEQIIAIPSWARKVKYGVKYLIISGDEFRFNNFGGLAVYFQKGINRSYVNLNMVRKPVSVDTTALDSLETLYTLNNYVNFDSAYANAMCQWLGPNTSKVKVKRKSSSYIDGSNLDTFNLLSDTIDIPTFSTSGGEPDFNNGFPDYISIQMFFAEWVSYLNNSGIPSGAIYFYEPFLYFTEF